jgi:acyl carrier protein
MADDNLPLRPGEALVTEMWRRTLRVASVGPDDRFFDLGGHSIAAQRITLQVRETFGVWLEFSHFLDNPTVGESLRLIERKMSAQVAGLTEAEVRAEVQRVT